VCFYAVLNRDYYIIKIIFFFRKAIFPPKFIALTCKRSVNEWFAKEVSKLPLDGII
jgi:hypothetical protein